MIRLKLSPRSFLLCLIGLIQVFSSPFLRAQENPATSPQPDPKVVEAFQKWEESYRKVQKMECQIEIINRDKIFDTTNKITASSKIVKTKLQNETKEYILINYKKNKEDNFVYFSKSKKGVARSFYDPKSATQDPYQFFDVNLNERQSRVTFFGFLIDPTDIWNFELSLFFMESKMILKKYHFKLIKEDEYYFYIDILPINNWDKMVFPRARLVLSKSNYLPRQIWREQPNGSEILIDIKSINLSPTLDLKDVISPNTREIQPPKIENYFAP